MLRLSVAAVVVAEQKAVPLVNVEVVVVAAVPSLEEYTTQNPCQRH